jgi:hypothetical protein
MSERVEESAMVPYRLLGVLIENDKRTPVVMWTLSSVLLKALNERVANQ